MRGTPRRRRSSQSNPLSIACRAWAYPSRTALTRPNLIWCRLLALSFSRGAFVELILQHELRPVSSCMGSEGRQT